MCASRGSPASQPSREEQLQPIVCALGVGGARARRPWRIEQGGARARVVTTRRENELGRVRPWRL
jgi:hypothetical protein